jgi:hypothetical protein
MQDMVDAVRATGATNILMVGGLVLGVELGLGQRVGGNAGFLLFRMHWWETAADMAYRPGSIAP